MIYIYLYTIPKGDDFWLFRLVMVFKKVVWLSQQVAALHPFN